MSSVRDRVNNLCRNARVWHVLIAALILFSLTTSAVVHACVQLVALWPAISRHVQLTCLALYLCDPSLVRVSTILKNAYHNGLARSRPFRESLGSLLSMLSEDLPTWRDRCEFLMHLLNMKCGQLS